MKKEKRVIVEDIEYIVTRHPVFCTCECFTWTEGDKTYRYYFGDAETPDQKAWIERGMLPGGQDYEEPPHYIGKGLDIIVADEEYIFAIRPSFIQYGYHNIELSEDNDYSQKKDLSGIGFTKYLTDRSGPLPFEGKFPEVQRRKAEVIFTNKSRQIEKVKEKVKAEETPKKELPPIDLYLS